MRTKNGNRTMTKTITALLIAAFMIMIFPNVAFAYDGSIDPLSVSSGHSNISATGRSVTFSGTSTSLVKEDTLYIYSYLQQLQGSTWTTINSTSKSVNDAMSVSVSKTVTVTGGYYYRTMSYHESYTNGVSYGFYSYSSQKWVG